MASRVTTPPKPASGNLRADAVSLEVPVKVHGSRVTEVVRGITPHTEPFEEQTNTMIVFPQGGVIRMSTVVSAGQMLVLTNLKSRQDAICRVVKVRTFSNMPGYVEVEFTHPQQGYWGVHFPSDAPRPSIKVVPPPPATPQTGKREKPVSDISWASAQALTVASAEPADVSTPEKDHEPASAPAVPHALPSKPATVAPTPFVPPSKPESTFISIGSQEEVQPAASSTAGLKAAPALESERERRAAEITKDRIWTDSPPTPPIARPPSLSIAELRGDEYTASVSSHTTSEAPETKEERKESPATTLLTTKKPRSTFGSLTGGSTLGASIPARSELLHAHADSIVRQSEKQVEKRHTNWLLIAACAAVLLASVGAGILYLRNWSFVSTPVGSNPATSNQPATTNPSPEAASPVAQLAPTSEPSVVVYADPAAASQASDSSQSKPSAPSNPPTRRVSPGMIAGALNAHPVASQRSNDNQPSAAPSLEAAAAPANANAALPGIVPSSNDISPPAPDIKPEGPVRVGGEVKAPHLIFSTPPIYPLVAKQASVEGDVVVQTTIDVNGNVASMQVVSGPEMLRQAALDSLRRWRYEPSKMNGQPIATQMEVTIRFRL
jgi:protein TonB